MRTSGASQLEPIGRASAPVVRVAVVDENEMFALGIRAALAGAVELTSDRSEHADVAVVSPTAAAKYQFPCPLVVCGSPPIPTKPGNVILAVLPRGTLTPERLRASVYAAAAGLRVSPSEPSPVPRMDDRCLAVLELLAAGAGTRTIAQELGYSDRTIKSVVRELQVLLGARNRTHAVAEGVKQGLIGLPAEG